jgi:tetratricopeptide (TPR) repeat protein
MRALRVAIVVILGTGVAVANDGATARHLLAGVRAFQAARYEDALVELRVVARAADAPPDLAFYLGPTLYKLGRHREALAVFVGSHAAPDALTDFYLGETYYQLTLYRKARAVFAGLRTRMLGPVLDDAAGRYVDMIDAAYRQRPDNGIIDFYIAEGQELAAREPAVAAEYFDEARLVEATTHHRHDEIVAALAAAWNAAGQPRKVIDTLAAEPGFAPETSWQLARAYAATNDGHARSLLDDLVKRHTARAAEAAALLAKLPP